MKKQLLIILGICAPLLAQNQTFYTGKNVTGQLVLVRTVNALAQAQSISSVPHLAGQASDEDRVANTPKLPAPWVPPGISLLEPPRASGLPVLDISNSGAGPHLALPVNAGNSSGFLGLTHADQRNANNGNQLNQEPPSPGIAAGNGFIVEGVNNAFMVYNTSGAPLLPVVISSNQLFGLPPQFDRTSEILGPSPTDMRVFYDAGINRWFVVQRIIANDANGNFLPQTQEILAVSQTGDPTGTYNIYVIDTTTGIGFNCPCVSDYPEIGADQYGFYISANEHNYATRIFGLATNILAVSKSALASGATAPTAYKFEIPFVNGYEFAIQPAATPPGGSNFLASGGVEYFVSSLQSGGDNLALWAMTNTSSLTTSNPLLTLIKTIIPTLAYMAPGGSPQKPGPLPYGSSLTPPARLAVIDGGDSRVQSVEYAGGRLYVTLETQVTDDNGKPAVGAAYVVISPAYRSGQLTGAALRQGYVGTNGNNLLRPALAVNAQGSGAMVFTLVGPDYFPSAAFLPFSGFTPGPAILLAAAGAAPEDGFTGYPPYGPPARWGDYSDAVVSTDGSIFLVTEYIPNAPRVKAANWGTYITHYTP